MQEQYIVGIYCRLSRDDERAGESVSIENQKELLTRYVQEQGWTLYDYYVDDGVSGTTFDRPGFNRLVADATAKKINLALCKDLSRLGRDYIEAGKYTDFIFPSFGCRFIALNDGVDTAKQNNEMVMILKNVMNDLYARDTSAKIKAVKRSTFKSGKYIGCYAPIGYRKDPEDHHHLLIDPMTAPIVKRIFDMRMQGYGFRKIARTLNEDKVPSPRGFYYLSEQRENLRGETPFWNDVTVKSVLRNEVYLGHMVQNKTGTVSYKNHKQIAKPEAEWIRVENTHEALVSQETWDFVQSLDNHPARNRSGKSGVVHLYASVLHCMDCGATMRHYSDSRKKADGTPQSIYEAYCCNRYASGGKAACSAHHINSRVLTEIVLTDIRQKALMAQRDPKHMRALILKQHNTALAEQTQTLRTSLAALDKRIAELDKLVVAAYEDKVAGRIPEALCIQFLTRYENERQEKLAERTALTAQLDARQEDEKSVDDWIELIRGFAYLDTLERPTLLRLINRIDVSERRVENGQQVRDIKIHYNFVGYIEI